MTKITKKIPCTFQCPHCQNCYPYPSNLKLHIDSIHLRLRPFECQFCKINNAPEQKFALKHHLERHIKTHHPDPDNDSKNRNTKNTNEDDDDDENSSISLSMTESLKSFDESAKRNFVDDINSIASNKLMSNKTNCEKCDKSFNDKESLIAHNNFLHGNLQYNEQQMQQRNHEFMQKIHESLDHFNINPKKQLQLEQEHQSLLVSRIEQRHKVYSNILPLSTINSPEKMLIDVNNLPKKSIFKKNWRHNNKKRKIDPNRKLTCFSCDYQTNVKANFKRHLFKMHYFLKKDSLLLYEQQTTNQKTKKICYSCLFCNFKKEKQLTVQHHCKKVHKKQRDSIFEKIKTLYVV